MHRYRCTAADADTLIDRYVCSAPRPAAEAAEAARPANVRQLPLIVERGNLKQKPSINPLSKQPQAPAAAVEAADADAKVSQMSWHRTVNKMQRFARSSVS